MCAFELTDGLISSGRIIHRGVFPNSMSLLTKWFCTLIIDAYLSNLFPGCVTTDCITQHGIFCFLGPCSKQSKTWWFKYGCDTRYGVSLPVGVVPNWSASSNFNFIPSRILHSVRFLNSWWFLEFLVNHETIMLLQVWKCWLFQEIIHLLFTESHVVIIDGHWWLTPWKRRLFEFLNLKQ